VYVGYSNINTTFKYYMLYLLKILDFFVICTSYIEKNSGGEQRRGGSFGTRHFDWRAALEAFRPIIYIYINTHVGVTTKHTNSDFFDVKWNLDFDITKKRGYSAPVKVGAANQKLTLGGRRGGGTKAAVFPPKHLSPSAGGADRSLARATKQQTGRP
jgi:hypothetical protein